VVRSWRWLEAQAAERSAFPDLATALALPATVAGPENRLRSVRAIAVPGLGTCYLKLFRRTQWKNRLRFLLTRPRCADDAQREAAMAQALRAAGIAAPRPIAVGRAGASSSLLLAALPGTSLAELVQGSAVDDALLRRAAVFCGALLRRGFWLPDLSLDHVYVDGPALGILDLHNGTLAHPGPPPRRLCLRVLRHFRRSALSLPIASLPALRFAVRLLRAAGRGAEARRLLQALPPLQSWRRYEAPGRSERYAQRDMARGRAESELLARVWPGRPGDLVLDAPCGTGRVAALLRERFGARVLPVDAAWAMLQQARASHQDTPLLRADALALPLRDGAADGVVLFRFLHHLPPELARRALAEACRVARRFVVVSWFHPCSVNAFGRRLRRLFGARQHRFALGRATLHRWLRSHGMEPDAEAAQLPWLRDLWVASFIRPDRSPD
jgi:SAM-dependent methyltransferase